MMVFLFFLHCIFYKPVCSCVQSFVVKMFTCLLCALRWSAEPWRCADGAHGNWQRAQRWEEPPHSGAGDPGGLPALHGGHLARLPLLPAAHHPGSLREDHGCQLPLRPPRYASVSLLPCPRVSVLQWVRGIKSECCCIKVWPESWL